MDVFRCFFITLFFFCSSSHWQAEAGPSVFPLFIHQKLLLALALSAFNVNAFWLMGIESLFFLARPHTGVFCSFFLLSSNNDHENSLSVFSGGSNFRFNTTTLATAFLRI